MNGTKRRLLYALALAAMAHPGLAKEIAGITPKPAPRPGELKGSAALCDPALASVDLDINNVRARLINGGNMWWDPATATARYEVPKGSNKHSLYGGSVWVGGYDKENNLKVCAQTYRQNGNDYWPGPLDPSTNSIDKSVCSDWDKIWRINKSDLFAFREMMEQQKVIPTGPQYDDIKQWPALGNIDALGKSGLPLNTLTDATAPGVKNHTYAPFFDADGDGLYNWRKGDYPEILGDQYTWWVFNDVGNSKTETGSTPIGMEVQTSAFAFSRKDYMNDATFINYRLINRGALTMTETYMATWTDADLGYAKDDYIGCDTSRGLGILYNASAKDGNGEVTSYGNQVPMVGVDFFIGPKKDTVYPDGSHIILDTLDMTFFNYFNNGGGPTGDPHGALEYFRVMTGHNRIGVHLQDDRTFKERSTGYNTGPLTNFAYPGNPNNPSEWSQCQCTIAPDDRRFVHSSGPFTLYSGGTTNDLTIGVVWVADVGGCPNATFSRIRAADDLAQELFDSHFKVIRGPDAPDMTIREGDRELIFYLTNDNPSSNNYKEQYGYGDSSKYRERVPDKAAKGWPDSIYKFEGYRVFQLKNNTVTPAQIFGLNGEVNNEVAVEVFQTDIKNGITTIINYENDPDKGSTVFVPQTKVKGKDSGIVHSFRLTRDAFATGNDSRFVNYHNYYFVAIAYAHNDYRTFSYNKIDSTQKRPYLESTMGWLPGFRNTIPVLSAMPNPTNGSMGTDFPDSVGYGTGVVIKRLEGDGNGNNFLQLDEASEATALQSGEISFPVYKRGQGPVSVKVVDPRRIKAYDWELWLTGTATDPTGRGLIDNQSAWKLVGTDGKGNTETIYSDHNLNVINEQILTKFGLSVTISQVKRPGEDENYRKSGNGYINSTVTFADKGKLWLAGVNDEEFENPRNWIRSGESREPDPPGLCDVGDIFTPAGNSQIALDPKQAYESMLSQSSPLKGTWAPFGLAAGNPNSFCGFGVAPTNGNTPIGTFRNLQNLSNVDIVFTSDMSKWTRCPVFELQDDSTLAEGRARKFNLRKHAGWNKQVDGSGNPVYSTDPADEGMSWFPGYAINQTTGKRVNIIMGEDSYLKYDNGADMIWNPSSRISGITSREIINGGKHYIYVTDSLYDEGESYARVLRNTASMSGSQLVLQRFPLYQTIQWVGLPLVANNAKLLPLKDGLIPTETRLSFRVTVPYRYYTPPQSTNLRNEGRPLYSFTTKDIAQRPLTDENNRYAGDMQQLLDRIRVVPNPYYGYAGYENNRLDTRVRIINLPNRATISIYSLDGTLIRRLEHANDAETTRGYEDWDIRNVKGLQIASGMYLVHVKAEGIGETVIKWFGSMRPVDITTY